MIQLLFIVTCAEMVLIIDPLHNPCLLILLIPLNISWQFTQNLRNITDLMSVSQALMSPNLFISASPPKPALLISVCCMAPQDISFAKTTQHTPFLFYHICHQ